MCVYCTFSVLLSTICINRCTVYSIPILIIDIVYAESSSHTSTGSRSINSRGSSVVSSEEEPLRPNESSGFLVHSQQSQSTQGFIREDSLSQFLQQG